MNTKNILCFMQDLYYFFFFVFRNEFQSLSIIKLYDTDPVLSGSVLPEGGGHNERWNNGAVVPLQRILSCVYSFGGKSVFGVGRHYVRKLSGSTNIKLSELINTAVSSIVSSILLQAYQTTTE